MLPPLSVLIFADSRSPLSIRGFSLISISCRLTFLKELPSPSLWRKVLLPRPAGTSWYRLLQRRTPWVSISLLSKYSLPENRFFSHSASKEFNHLDKKTNYMFRSYVETLRFQHSQPLRATFLPSATINPGYDTNHCVISLHCIEPCRLEATLMRNGKPCRNCFSGNDSFTLPFLTTECRVLTNSTERPVWCCCYKRSSIISGNEEHLKEQFDGCQKGTACRTLVWGHRA